MNDKQFVLIYLFLGISSIVALVLGIIFALLGWWLICLPFLFYFSIAWFIYKGKSDEMVRHSEEIEKRNKTIHPAHYNDLEPPNL